MAKTNTSLGIRVRFVNPVGQPALPGTGPEDGRAGIRSAAGIVVE